MVRMRSRLKGVSSRLSSRLSSNPKQTSAPKFLERERKRAIISWNPSWIRQTLEMETNFQRRLVPVNTRAALVVLLSEFVREVAGLLVFVKSSFGQSGGSASELLRS